MGKRGPPATPLRILKGRGSRRGKAKDGKTAESRPPPRPPAPPRWLRADGKRAWRWLVGELVTMGLYGTADRRALERYCVLYQRWRATLRDLEGGGEYVVLEDRQGNLVERPRPQVVVASDLNKERAQDLAKAQRPLFVGAAERLLEFEEVRLRRHMRKAPAQFERWASGFYAEHRERWFDALWPLSESFLRSVGLVRNQEPPRDVLDRAMDSVSALADRLRRRAGGHEAAHGGAVRVLPARAIREPAGLPESSPESLPGHGRSH